MYTPQFSDTAAVTIRRLAWALGTNMPATVNRLVRLLPALFESAQVCQRCKDSTKCRLCAFSQTVNEQDKAALVAL
jgi:recombinational DNA repair protein RecR